MKTFSLILLAASPLLAHGASPIGKVLQMIGDLQAKIIGEGTECQKIYDEFSEWCEDQSKNLHFEIKTGKANVEELTATITAEAERIKALNTKVEELAANIATDEADLKAATEVRNKEHADFAAEEKELVEVSSMLERASAILERELAKSGASFVQMNDANKLVNALSTIVQASGFSAADASKLTALVQSSSSSDDSDSDAGAPAAAVYSGQSGNIIETLNNLLEKAQTQLDEARKEETNAQNNFEMLKQSLSDSMRFGNKDLDAAKQNIAASTEAKAAAEGDLEVTTKDLKEDETTLSDLHHNCMTKAQDFEAETKSRGEELAAIAEAKKIIQETTSGAEEQTYSFLQVSAQNGNFAIVRFVRELGRKQNAPALTQLASRLASIVRLNQGADVFAKIKGLISDMITRLEDEAAADATHKAYCDKEMGETTAKQEDKEAEIEKLSTKIDQMSSRSAKLKEQVATLQKELAELAASQTEMDKVRTEEKELYDRQRPELEKGLEGIKLALKVLRDYYSKGDAAHSSSEGAGASIIGLLEVCESDFSKGLAEMIATEENAASEYDAQTKENEVEKATKDQDVKYKTKEATGLDKSVSDTSSDRQGVQAELDAVMDYMAKLKSECVEVAETYEERKARREAEIAGLKEGLGILGGEAMLLQKSRRHAFLRPAL